MNNRRHRVSSEEVDDVARAVRQDLISTRKTVSLTSVVHEVCEKFQVASIEELGFFVDGQCRFNKSIVTTLRDLKIKLCRLANHVRSFIATRDVSTLWDLQEDILKEFSTESHNYSSFDELGVGPLVKFPEVVRLFRTDRAMVNEAPEVTATDLYHLLCEYHKSIKFKRVEQDKFMAYTATQRGVINPASLCIKTSDYFFGSCITMSQSIRQRQQKQREKFLVDDLKLRELQVFLASF